MARVRLLQLHQEQQQHGPAVVTGTQSAATTTNQWLDLVPSNPILPQIALPGTAPSAMSTPHNSNNHLQQHHHLNHSQDENGGSSSTESAHQARGGRHHNAQHQPSKIPVVKPLSCPVPTRPTSSYRGGDTQCQSWTKCKSDQSLPRNWESINNNHSHNKSNGGSSIGSGIGGVKQRGNKTDNPQNHHQHRSRRDSGGGGGASLTRARSQNNHAHQRVAAVSFTGGAAKDFNRTTGNAVAVSAGQLQLQQPASDDTNKVRPTKRFTNMFNSWMRKS